MSFDYYMPVRIISVSNCVLKFDFKKLGGRAFIIGGSKGLFKSGLMDDLQTALEKRGVKYKIFEGIRENPNIKQCHAAGAQAAAFGADFIIGAGGGSAMDAAKAASVYACNPELKPVDIFDNKKYSTAMPVVLIGTTAGTGSEVTPVSVLTYDSGSIEIKKSVRNSLLFAKFALCDAKYTQELPWEITANTALDFISHAVESLYSVKATEFETIYACETLRIGWDALIRAHWRVVMEKKEIDLGLRERLLTASIMAGMAINGTGTCFPHSLSYSLTMDKKVPHGKACAAFLPEFIKLNQSDDRRTKLLLKSAGETSLDTFLDGVRSMTGVLPVISAYEAEEYTAIIKDSPSLQNSVIPIYEEDVLRLYKKLFVKQFG